MNSKFAYIILFSILLASCEDYFLGEEPGSDPKQVFETFWSDFENHYAHFILKDIDWDSVYTKFEPRITQETKDRELYYYFKEMILLLEDGHSNLYCPYGIVQYDYDQGIPSNYIPDLSRYFSNDLSIENNEIIEANSLKKKDIGYIRIKTFSGVGSGLKFRDDRYFVIDDILEDFKNKAGIIVDIRNNAGGNSLNAETVAGRFADKRRVYCKEKMKNGPGKRDFSDWTERSIKPRGNWQYMKPVAVLTNRRNFSTAELFVLAMGSFSHVTVVGDTTGGGSGNPVFRELPNGWTIRLSTSYKASLDGRIYELGGIPPDIPVWISQKDSLNGRDRILEKAIDLLTEN
jgi:hypothetical protein